MSRIYKHSHTNTGAVLDRGYNIWQEPPDELKVGEEDYILAQPCRTLGGICQDGPIESYRRLQQLVNTHAVFPHGVMRSGARALQQHFSFED
jgi:hypothetical protein